MGYEYDLLHGDITNIGKVIKKSSKDTENLRETLHNVVKHLQKFQQGKRDIDDKLEAHDWLFQAIRDDNSKRDKLIYIVSAVGVIASIIFPLAF